MTTAGTATSRPSTCPHSCAHPLGGGGVEVERVVGHPGGRGAVQCRCDRRRRPCDTCCGRATCLGRLVGPAQSRQTRSAAVGVSWRAASVSGVGRLVTASPPLRLSSTSWHRSEPVSTENSSRTPESRLQTELLSRER